MGAIDAKKREVTAKKLAIKAGCSERTIRRFKAESRDAFEKRAKERRELAYNFRVVEDKGWEEIATLMNTTVYSVQGLVKRERQYLKDKAVTGKKEGA